MSASAETRAKKETGTRERIVRVSVKLFQAKGYHGAGLTEILTLAGAPKGSMYHHFPGGKEDLALAALDWLSGEVDAFLEGHRRAGAGGTWMALGMAEYCAAAVANSGGMNGSLVSVLAQDAVPGSPRIESALRQTLERWTSRLCEGFSADGAGDPAAKARQTLALMEGAMILARIEGRPQLVVEIVAESMTGRG